MKAEIESSNGKISLELYDSGLIEKLKEILPIRRSASRWGDEVYFELPIHADLDNTQKEIVNIGDIGFWPDGDCFCLFFGKTPLSCDDKIRPASAVNIIGKVKDGIDVLKKILDGEELVLRSIEQPSITKKKKDPEK